MDNQEFFLQAFIYLLAAVISVPFAKRMGFGSVLGYLLAGIIIGPFVLGLTAKGDSDIMHFAEFGVVLMLFLIGLELKPSVLWQMRRSIFGLGGLQLVITAALLSLVALLFEQSLNQAISIGLILALSSTAIVLQTLNEKNLLKTRGGRASISILLFQDIAVIPILAVLPLLVIKTSQPLDQPLHPSHAIAHLSGWQQLLIILFLVAGIIIIGKFASRYIFRLIAGTGLRDIFTATALLIVISIAIAMERVGLSPALGTFIAGVVLADSEYRHELESNIEPFKGLLLGLFFITVGASIDFTLLLERPALIILLLGILIFVKAAVLLFLSIVFNIKSGANWLLTFALAQSGEFAFVLVSFSLNNKLFDTEVASILILVVALSMAMTPLLLLINEYIVQPFYNRKEIPHTDEVIKEKENPVIIAGFGRFGLVVGRILLANGFKATILDNNPDNIQVLKKLGFTVYYGDASRPDLLESAGINKARLLIIALDDKEKSLKMVEHIKHKYPHLHLIARASDLNHASEYNRLGFENYKMELSYSAIEVGISALIELGFRPNQAKRAANIFKYHNLEIRKELFKLWEGDKKHYINEVRKYEQQLEEILKSEFNHSIHEADAAWDVTSLKEEVHEIYSKNNTNKSNGK